MKNSTSENIFVFDTIAGNNYYFVSAIEVLSVCVCVCMLCVHVHVV